MSTIDDPKTRAASWLTLLASTSTLICCALPALLVALGAGAALSSLIATVPQLVWFSVHKTGVFASAAVMLTLSGLLQWQSRYQPCPADPALAQACRQLRARSRWIYGISVALFAIGGFFACVLPIFL